jgi:tetratricopeptide (TPR) repeat protein
VLNDSVNFPSDDEDINLEYLYNIGVSHAKRGNLRDAIFYFNKVLEVEPEHINALVSKGNVLGKLGKYGDAITCYDIVLKIKPDHITCLLNKGRALHYLGIYESASSCYDKILEQQPEHASTLYHKACTKSLQKNIEHALVFLEKSIVLDSKYAKKASQDKDFDILQNDSRFKALIA